MADTFTTHYNLTKPQIGGDPDTWGNLLNANFDTIDGQLYTASTYALPLTGGTLTGALNGTTASFSGTVISGTSSGVVQAGSSSGNYAQIRFDGNISLNGGAFAPLAYNGSSPTFATVTATANVISNGAVKAGNSIVGGNGSLSFEPTFGSGTGAVAIDGSGNVTAPGYFRSTYNTSNPGSTATMAINLSGSYGGGIHFNDPGGSNSDWCLYTGSGTLLLGYTTGGGALSLKSSLTNGGVWIAADFQANSDMRLKTGIRKLRRGLDELKRMLPREYVKDGREEIGFIAQEAQQVIPEAVTEGDDGYLRLSYGQVTALLARAILEIDARLELAGL